MPIDTLEKSPEAFLTSTSRDVHPIRRAGSTDLPAAPGPLTRHAIEVWVANAAGDIDP